MFRRAGDHHLARLAAHELSWIHGVDGDFAAQEGAARELLAEAEAASDANASVMALRSVAATLWPRGRVDEAEALTRRAIELAAADDNPANVVHARTFLAMLLAFDGRLAEASEALDAARAADPGRREPLVIEVGLLLSVVKGQNRAALGEARREAAGMGPGQSWVMLVGALAGIESGETGEAQRFLGTLAEVMADRRYWMMTLQYRWISGLLVWQQGDPATARSMLESVSDDLLGIDAVVLASPVLVDLGELSVETGHHDVLVRAVDRLDQIAQRVDGGHHRALAALGAGWAALAQGRNDDAEHLTQRAAADFAASGHRMYQARSHHVAGRAAAAHDRHRSAQAFRKAITLFEAGHAGWRRDRSAQALAALGRHGRRTLAAVAGPSPLTARERQVAVLAIEGLTAREVAERLYIGERTVETHLANIYAKFGIHSRMELFHHATELRT